MTRRLARRRSRHALAHQELRARLEALRRRRQARLELEPRLLRRH